MARWRRFPAAFIGLGGLEWHGERLAVGNDALKVEKLCELAAAASGGFATPTIWYGEPRTIRPMEANHNKDGLITDKMELPAADFTTRHFGISEADRVAFYQQLIYHVSCAGADGHAEDESGVFLSGHCPLKECADKAIARFHRVKRFAGTRACCGIGFHYAGHPRVGGDHAGHRETGYLWYLRPGCADLSVFLGRRDEPLVGVGGKGPRRHAILELGRRACRRTVRGMVAKARRLVAEVGGKA